MVKEEGGGDTDTAMVKELSTGYGQVEKQAIRGFDVVLFVSRNASCSSAG
jgi:hypothetical protein